MTETRPDNQTVSGSLASVPLGTYCCVRVTGDPELQVRLKRMGICDRRTITVLQAGDPMILSVVGARIAVSRYLADFVEVASGRFVAEVTVAAETPSETA